MNPMLKKFLLAYLLGFFLAVMVMSLHHHHDSFKSHTCSICKVKSSLHGSFHKVKAGTTSFVTGIFLLFAAGLPWLSSFINDKKLIFIQSHLRTTCPNKASPGI